MPFREKMKDLAGGSLEHLFQLAGMDFHQDVGVVFLQNPFHALEDRQFSSFDIDFHQVQPIPTQFRPQFVERSHLDRGIPPIPDSVGVQLPFACRFHHAGPAMVGKGHPEHADVFEPVQRDVLFQERNRFRVGFENGHRPPWTALAPEQHGIVADIRPHIQDVPALPDFFPRHGRHFGFPDSREINGPPDHGRAQGSGADPEARTVADPGTRGQNPLDPPIVQQERPQGRPTPDSPSAQLVSDVAHAFTRFRIPLPAGPPGLDGCHDSRRTRRFQDGIRGRKHPGRSSVGKS